MVHIMWFEWSDRWQTHPKCLQTCSCSSEWERERHILRNFNTGRSITAKYFLSAIFCQCKSVRVDAEPRPWLFEASRDSTTCLWNGKATLSPCKLAPVMWTVVRTVVWMLALAVSSKETSEESFESEELPGSFRLQTQLHKGHRYGLFIKLKYIELICSHII